MLGTLAILQFLKHLCNSHPDAPLQALAATVWSLFMFIQRRRKMEK